ncbi:MAG: NADH-quinone oxidoreductase subunit C [Rhodospirillales bacterium]|nr:NADH-quinone oxidoreductase subunit C [Rhodospirillales bacterium]
MTAWEDIAARLAREEARFLGLWGEPGRVHLAWAEPDGMLGHCARDCPDGHYPSLGRVLPVARRLERAMRDLYGLRPEGLDDARPWLAHQAEAREYVFLPAEGADLHQVPVGPVHAGIIEPGHFRFTCDGETVVRLEARLGYAHKGVERLLAGASLEDAARIAGRISGDSTVAYALAFARAAETALGLTPPPRAMWLRGLAAEMERIGNHIGDVGAICNDASFALMLAHCAALRERVLRAAAGWTGHRLMMDAVVPGGMAVDLTEAQAAAFSVLAGDIRARFRRLERLYDGTISLQDRTVTTGIVRPELAARFAAGGFVGRASGGTFDARRAPGYPPYDALAFDVPSRTEGDVDARVRIRIAEIEQSLSLIEQILDRLPEGPVRLPVPPGSGEAIALVEGFRGDVLAYARLAEGRVAHAHLRDPSWFQWPLLEAAIEGNIVADFPLCNKSFNCSYSGVDL